MENATHKPIIIVELAEQDFETLVYLMEHALKDNTHTPESRTKLENLHKSFKAMHTITKKDPSQRPVKTN